MIQGKIDRFSFISKYYMVIQAGNDSIAIHPGKNINFLITDDNPGGYVEFLRALADVVERTHK